MVAHSRRHSESTAGDLDFMEEVLGSLEDLRNHGFATTVFVQPGSWRDSLYFDTPQKVRTWRGALLRTASLVSECYDSPGTIPSPPNDSLALCYSHVTISDALTKPQILAAWRQALQQHEFTTFLVHSYRMPSQDFLDFFLDSLVAARRERRVRVIRTSAEAFFPVDPNTDICRGATMAMPISTPRSAAGAILGAVTNGSSPEPGCASGTP